MERCPGFGWRSLRVMSFWEVRSWQILLQKSAAAEGPLVMSIGFVPPSLAALRNYDATQCTEPEREAVVRPVPRTVAGSERWRPEQTHPGHLAGRAAGADRASGCASSVRTSSRSFCARAATARSSRFQRTTEQRLGHARGYRAGPCVMAPLGSAAV